MQVILLCPHVNVLLSILFYFLAAELLVWKLYFPLLSSGNAVFRIQFIKMCVHKRSRINNKITVHDVEDTVYGILIMYLVFGP